MEYRATLMAKRGLFSLNHAVQEALEQCWTNSPLRAAARRLFYIAIHQVSLLSLAATVARRLHIDVHGNDDDANA